ncbi:MAG: DUF6695 family protein [Candidatus Woesearchaeota archaeon]
MKEKRDGYAIALSWPQTYCRHANTWYDPILSTLRISQNKHYRVGHAAIVLVNKKGDSHYYDFGRYTTPYGHGRARSHETDHDLKLKTKIKRDKQNKIINFNELLQELQQKDACHGEGDLHASYCEINFDTANKKARELNKKPHIHYGPFTPKGTNCSRFVKTIILAGKPKLKHKLKLHIMPLTPTPQSNIHALTNKTKHKPLIQKKFDPHKVPKTQLNENQKPPTKPNHLKQELHWLGGVGGGTWFDIKKINTQKIKATLYAPNGEKITHGIYKTKQKHDADEVTITYPSHCEIITLTHKNKNITYTKHIKKKTKSITYKNQKQYLDEQSL